MPGSEHKVPGFRQNQGSGSSFGVSHFPYQNDIRVLPEDMLQGTGEGQGIAPKLSLDDSALVIRVNIFHGVFDCYNPGLFTIIV